MCVLVSATFNMLKLTRHVTFPGSLVCKLFFSVRVILGHSLMIVTAIAVSRFKQICHIIKCPIKTSYLRIFFVCSGIISALSCVPTFFFETVEIYKEYITGYKCMEIDTDARTLDRWKMTFIAVLYGICAFIITASYVSIAMHIYKVYCRQNTLNVDTNDSEKEKPI